MSRTFLYRDFLNENANLSTKNRTEMIELAYSFRNESLLKLVLFVLALLSLLSLILLYFVFKNKEIRRIFSLIHLDLKFLLLSVFIIYTIGCLNSFGFFAYQTLILLIDFEPSFYIWEGKHCYEAQIVFVSTIPQICLLLFVSIFLERLYISIGFKSNGMFGLLLCLIAVCLPIGGHLTNSNPTNSANERVFCGSAITTFGTITALSTNIGILFDFAISLLDFLLLLYNKRKIKSYKKRKDFNLEKSFNLKSIELSILFIYPISLLHAITFSFQLIAYFQYIKHVETTSLINGILLFEASNFGRILANFIVIGTVWYLNWARGRKSVQIANFDGAAAADEYFRQFKAMIA